jgi:hypothetical protein
MWTRGRIRAIQTERPNSGGDNLVTAFQACCNFTADQSMVASQGRLYFGGGRLLERRRPSGRLYAKNNRGYLKRFSWNLILWN